MGWTQNLVGGETLRGGTKISFERGIPPCPPYPHHDKENPSVIQSYSEDLTSFRAGKDFKLVTKFSHIYIYIYIYIYMYVYNVYIYVCI